MAMNGNGSKGACHFFPGRVTLEMLPVHSARTVLISPYSGRDLCKVTPVILHRVVSPDDRMHVACTSDNPFYKGFLQMESAAQFDHDSHSKAFV